MRATTRTLAIGTALAVGLVLGVASPALADAAEDGNQYCRAGETESMVLKGRYGDLYTRGPGDAVYVYRGTTTSSWLTRTDPGPGGYWRGVVVGASAEIDHPATYGYCLY